MDQVMQDDIDLPRKKKVKNASFIPAVNKEDSAIETSETRRGARAKASGNKRVNISTKKN